MALSSVALSLHGAFGQNSFPMQIRLQTLLTFVALSLLPLSAAGQGSVSDGLGVQNIGVSDGLSQNNVNGLALDARGFLWVGTDDGLDRYDGGEFVPVRNVSRGCGLDGGDPCVTRVDVDASGHVWVVGHRGAVFCYSPMENAYVRLAGRGGESLRLPSEGIVCSADSVVLLYGCDAGACAFRMSPVGSPECVWQDTVRYCFAAPAPEGVWLYGDGRLSLVGAAGRVRQLAPSGLTVSASAMTVAGGVALIADGSCSLRRVALPGGEVLPEVSGLPRPVADVVALSGSLVAAVHSDCGLTIVNAESGAICPRSSLGADCLASSRVSVVRDSQGGVWFYDGAGAVYHYDALNGILRRVVIMGPAEAAALPSLRVNVVPDVMVPGIYWIASLGGGLVRYDENADVAQPVISKRAYVPEYLQCAVQDSAGNLWLGSEGVGLVKISLRRYVSRSLRPGEPLRFSAKNNVVAVLESVDGNVWMGVKNGDIYVYDPNLMRELCHKQSIRPTHMAADSRGRIWVATDGFGVFVYDLSTFAELAHYTHSDDNFMSLASDRVLKVVPDDNGRIWLVMADGGVDLVEDFRRSETRFRHFFAANAKVTACDAMLDSEGLLWLATDRGFICYAPSRLIKDSEDYVTYKFDDEQPAASVRNNEVRTICEDPQKRICVGTAGGGLCRLVFDVGHVRFVRFTERDGLPSNVVSAIVCTDDSTLWVATESGLSRFNLRTEKFSNLRAAETDFGNLFNSHACAIRSNGNILWGSLDGLVDLDPHMRISDEKGGNANISTISVDGKMLVFGGDDGEPSIDRPAAFARRVSLPPDFDELCFRIADMGRSGGRQSDYVYKMEGVDADWEPLDASRVAEYRRLPPGDYTFRVRNGGNGAETSVIVSVASNWWSLPIKVLLALAAVALAFVLPLVIFKILRKQTAEAIAEDKVKAYKSTFMRTINREVRSPMRMIQNTLATIKEAKGGMADELRPLLFLVEKNMTKISGMVGAMLDKKESSSSLPLNLENTSMAPFLGDVVKSADIPADNKKNISTSLDVPGGWRVLIDRDKVSKIVGILLTEAYKVTPANGCVSVKAYQNKRQQCAIEVADTGPGVPYERQDSIFSSSVEDAPCNDIEVALSVVADYVKAHHGEVFYTARPAGGSLMTVLLPTDYSAYPDANIVADTVDAGDADDSADLQPDSVTSADFSLPPDPVVLVVNDNEAVRNFMADRLRPYFHVVVAENARMARGKIDAMMPDAIVCEAHMDGDDGVELLRSLKGNFNSSHVPFFLVSSPSVSDLGSDVDCFGADGLIVKPINYASLVARVRRAVARVLSLRVNFAKDRGIIRAPQADDAAFMATFIENVEVNAARVNFGIEELAVEMKMGRNDLHRRLVQLTGCTPGEYIKLWRLNQAMLAITGGRETPVQAMQNAGVSDVAYFNKCFMRLYGSAIAKAMPASIA